MFGYMHIGDIYLKFGRNRPAKVMNLAVKKYCVP
jgi:hypothetical protein